MSQFQRGVYISTYGCQMNVNDTERMYSLLEMSNYHPVSTPDQASLIIINSCSVREKPVHKVHSEVGRYKDLKAKNPALRIGVGGCVAQQEKKKLLSDIPLLDFVFGTDSIDQLPSIVADVEDTEEKVNSTKFSHGQPYQVETLIRNPGVSTFVNITKGCDNFCTFCVVPFTRGRERSRKMSELITDINNLTKRGVKEVTLLGQNVNSYKSECGADFGTLMKTVATDTDIMRIRYTTSHPKDFNQELVDISQEYREKICDYIHLPAQCGNSEVLDRMNRGYTREDYLRKVEMIKKAIPGVALSTDIIVGFPGETEEQFKETLSMIEEVQYDGIYAFKYSPRPFTKAARWDDHCSEEEKSERLERVFALQRPIALELSQKTIGQVYEVLVEENEEGFAIGRNTQNRKVKFQAPDKK
ncbi:MAG: tRNA (N6-isopentenyl adenosine(37)-C2)-methylthiotransferase MiaB, partial [Bdellovibrionales bacterium]|nr:tRNA (N6-isopentenyl adenosine(37)-C2)-methylthiotransferase MiaB [Bdellovibrionales bacterium]